MRRTEVDFIPEKSEHVEGMRFAEDDKEGLASFFEELAHHSETRSDERDLLLHRADEIRGGEEVDLATVEHMVELLQNHRSELETKQIELFDKTIGKYLPKLRARGPR